MYVMISYDITDDRRRARVMKYLKDFGERVQLSVFECHLSDAQLKSVKKGIRELIDHRKDKVRYWPICNACAGRIEIEGWGDVREEESFSVV